MVRNIRIAPPRRATLVALGATAALLLAACGGDSEEPSTGSTGTAGGDGGGDGDVLVGLITKTETNPFFVKMKEGAQAKADELGVELQQLRRRVRRRQRGPGRGDREPDLRRAPTAS